MIAAAGSGQRVGRAENKVLLPLAGEPVIRHAVRVFQRHPGIERICLVVRPADRAALERCFQPKATWSKLLPWIDGGAERQQSVYNGLEALAADPPDWVLVHDAARPLCPEALVERVLAALETVPAVVPVLPIVDTVRRIGAGRSEVLERSELYRMQTPQGFHWDVLWRAHRWAREHGVRGTDDAQLLEAMEAGGPSPLTFVAGEARNLKVTEEDDLHMAEWLARQGSPRSP